MTPFGFPIWLPQINPKPQSLTPFHTFLIAFTTTASKEEAETLARLAIEHSHAVCVQVDGPVTSTYRWQGKVESSQEFRLAFKCMPDQLAGLEARILRAHSYDTPEWIVVSSEHVGEKYLNWAIEASTPARFP